MNSAVRSSLIAAGCGAGLMFLLDPSRGARRRALVRDKFVRAAHKTRDAADATGRDLRNRIQGVRAWTESRFTDEHVDARTLCARVRTELGRVASHPRAVCVSARDGAVTLSGDVLASEVSSIVKAVAGVRGVEDVQNRMTAHASPDGVPSLQGSSDRPGQWSTWLREGWSPSALLAAGAGTAAVAIAAVMARRVA
jgi:hypothetical protein